MASLLDTIRSNSGAIAGQKQGVTDESQGIAALLRARSGKAVSGPDTGASNLGEQQAVAASNTEMQNTVAPQAQAQQVATDVQASGQEQQVQQQKADIAQTRKFDDLGTKMKANSLLQDLEQSKGRLDAQEETTKVNQAAQMLRLQNQQYVQRLQQEGQLARLSDDNAFREELAQSTMGDNEELLRQTLGNKSIIDASENEFRKATGQMTAERAYDIFQNAQKAEKERAMYTGAAGIVTAGIGMAGAASSPAAGTKDNPGGGKVLASTPSSSSYGTADGGMSS